MQVLDWSVEQSSPVALIPFLHVQSQVLAFLDMDGCVVLPRHSPQFVVSSNIVLSSSEYILSTQLFPQKLLCLNWLAPENTDGKN
jgi:hypothetical protein